MYSGRLYYCYLFLNLLSSFLFVSGAPPPFEPLSSWDGRLVRKLSFHSFLFPFLLTLFDYTVCFLSSFLPHSVTDASVYSVAFSVSSFRLFLFSSSSFQIFITLSFSPFRLFPFFPFLLHFKSSLSHFHFLPFVFFPLPLFISNLLYPTFIFFLSSFPSLFPFLLHSATPLWILGTRSKTENEGKGREKTQNTSRTRNLGGNLSFSTQTRANPRGRPVPVTCPAWPSRTNHPANLAVSSHETNEGLRYTLPLHGSLLLNTVLTNLPEP